MDTRYLFVGDDMLLFLFLVLINFIIFVWHLILGHREILGILRHTNDTSQVSNDRYESLPQPINKPIPQEQIAIQQPQGKKSIFYQPHIKYLFFPHSFIHVCSSSQ